MKGERVQSADVQRRRGHDGRTGDGERDGTGKTGKHTSVCRKDGEVQRAANIWAPGDF